MKIPVYNKNVFTKKALLNSVQIHKELRALGGVVYLAQHKVYAIVSYDAVINALELPDVLISGKGVAISQLGNGPKTPSTLLTDGELHLKRKGILMKPLSPLAMKDLKSDIQTTAEQVVQSLVNRDSFEVMHEFAAHLPLTIVSNLVGLPEKEKAKMLKWGNAVFDVFGAGNWRAIRHIPTLFLEIVPFANRLNKSIVKPNSWGDKLFQAAEAGRISENEAKGMILDYVAPSLDTTIYATGRLFWELAKTPSVFQEIKSNPSLIPNAIEEAIRLSSPIRGFARYIKEECTVNGYTLEKDKRAIIYFASANMDENKFPNAGTFDIHRPAKDHVGMGHGKHKCVGMHLAKLEITELLKALCRHVNKIEASEPVPIVNNVLQGYHTLSGRLIA